MKFRLIIYWDFIYIISENFICLILLQVYLVNMWTFLWTVNISLYSNMSDGVSESFELEEKIDNDSSNETTDAEPTAQSKCFVDISFQIHRSYFSFVP